MSDYAPEEISALELLLRGADLPGWDGRVPRNEEELLAVVGGSKEEAYEVLGLLRAHLEEEARLDVQEAAVHYLQDHPGAVCPLEGRRVYSDGYLRFVVGLVQPGALAMWLPLSEVAGLCQVPLEEVEAWLSRQGRGT